MGGKSKALNDALNDVCVECPEQSAQVASNIQAAQEHCCRAQKDGDYSDQLKTLRLCLSNT
jgi:hypothetical protein